MQWCRCTVLCFIATWCMEPRDSLRPLLHVWLYTCINHVISHPAYTFLLNVLVDAVLQCCCQGIRLSSLDGGHIERSWEQGVSYRCSENAVVYWGNIIIRTVWGEISMVRWYSISVYKMFHLCNIHIFGQWNPCTESPMLWSMKAWRECHFSSYTSNIFSSTESEP